MLHSIIMYYQKRNITICKLFIQNGLFLDSPATTSATTYKLVTGIQQTEIKATYQNTSSYPSGLIIMELAQ